MKKTPCWLSNFNLEDISGKFNHSGERINKPKMRTRKLKTTGKKRKFDISKKDSQDRNNRRNNDIYSIAKASGTLDFGKEVSKDVSRNENVNVTEDIIIEFLDDIKSGKKPIED